jgi:hypothetical protein
VNLLIKLFLQAQPMSKKQNPNPPAPPPALPPSLAPPAAGVGGDEATFLEYCFDIFEMLVQHFVIVVSTFLKCWFNIFKILDQQFFLANGF